MTFLHLIIAGLFGLAGLLVLGPVGLLVGVLVGWLLSLMVIRTGRPNVTTYGNGQNFEGTYEHGRVDHYDGSWYWNGDEWVKRH